MRILITNDDGIHAAGLALAERVARSLTDDVFVVAPESEQSGVAHSLSINDPLRLREISSRHFAVKGTPTDCVIMGVRKLLADKPPDLILSGVNSGQNLAEDVSYSGTIAGAIEGTLLGIPSIAISLVHGGQDRFDTAARVAADLVERFLANPIGRPTLLNVNVPDVPFEVLAGTEVTRLGRRHKAQDTVKTVNPRNQTMYWVGAAGAAQDAGPGTDFNAVARNHVSITPLQVDLTHYPQIDQVSEWLAR